MCCDRNASLRMQIAVRCWRPTAHCPENDWNANQCRVAAGDLLMQEYGGVSAGRAVEDGDAMFVSAELLRSAAWQLWWCTSIRDDVDINVQREIANRRDRRHVRRCWRTPTWFGSAAADNGTNVTGPRSSTFPTQPFPTQADFTHCISTKVAPVWLQVTFQHVVSFC